MKNKVILVLFLIFSTQLIFAADTLVIDTVAIRYGVEQAMNIAEIITQHKPLVPFIPDHVTAGAVTAAIAFFIRLFAKRRLRKKGLLIDKKIADSNQPG